MLTAMLDARRQQHRPNVDHNITGLTMTATLDAQLQQHRPNVDHNIIIGRTIIATLDAHSASNIGRIWTATLIARSQQRWTHGDGNTVMVAARESQYWLHATLAAHA